MKKICRVCKEEKEFSEFHKKKDKKDGHRNECKECVKDIQKKYKDEPNFIEKRKKYDKKRYDENREEILEHKKEYHQENKEWINAKKREYHNKPEVKEKQKEYCKEYSIKNREVLREQNRESIKKAQQKYRDEHPHIIAWRSLLYGTLKRLGTEKQGHTIDELGYSAEELRDYISSLFTVGMDWDNHGEWHIDHIIPVSYFTSETPASIVCGLSNLQPLWATTREIDGVVYEGNLNKSNN